MKHSFLEEIILTTMLFSEIKANKQQYNNVLRD